MRMDRVWRHLRLMRRAVMQLGRATLPGSCVGYLRTRTVTPAVSGPRLMWCCGLGCSVREMTAQQSAEKCTFERCDSRKNRHMTLHKLIESGTTAKRRNRNLRLSIRQF